MNRRHLLTLLVGATAGCSSQFSESTESTTATAEASTPAPTDEPTRTETEQSTTTSEPTPTSEDADPAATLNAVYAELDPALETLETRGLDTEALTRRLDGVRTELERARQAGTADEARLDSLSDTRWVFDRLVRTFTRLDEVYAVHEQLHATYRESETTDETRSRLERLKTLADEAASASGTAAAQFAAIDEFAPTLDLQYDRFEQQVFRVSGAADSLTPLARGLDAAIPARQRYRQAVTAYENGAYRDAQDDFAELLNTFSTARERFEDADALSGPLEPPHARYLCDATAARLACVEYRAACREQRDGDEAGAARRREQAETRYRECSTGEETATPSG